MMLLDAVLSFKLFDSSGLSQKDRKFYSLQSPLKRIFGGQNKHISDSSISNEQESTYCNKNSRSRLSTFKPNVTVVERRNIGGSRNHRQA